MPQAHNTVFTDGQQIYPQKSNSMLKNWKCQTSALYALYIRGVQLCSADSCWGTIICGMLNHGNN